LNAILLVFALCFACGSEQSEENFNESVVKTAATFRQLFIKYCNFFRGNFHTILHIRATEAILSKFLRKLPKIAAGGFS
jgi:hypothetical protein